MNRLITYLTFNGNCREAMTFYQKCLGGTLTFEMLGESPGTSDLPPALKDYILNATLENNGFLLVGTDMCENKLIQGNSVSILFTCESSAELKRIYNSLLEGGQGTHPIAKTFWGADFGGLIDKYKIHWLFHTI